MLESVSVAKIALEQKIYTREKLKEVLDLQGLEYKPYVKAQGSPDKIPALIAEILEIEKEIEVLQGNYAQALREAEIELSRVKSDVQRQAMRMRYIDGMSITKIARHMDYSRSGVHYLLNNSEQN